MAAPAFDPDKHPRDKDGKFAALGGSAGGDPAQVASAHITAAGDDRLSYAAPTIEQMAKDPEKFEHDVKVFDDPKNYPGLRPDVFTGTVKEQAEKIRDTIASNLMAIWKYASDKVKSDGMIWYQSAHDIAQGLATKYDIPLASVVGTVAKLSPNKDWNMNVELAKQMVAINAEQQNHKWDEKMEAATKEIWVAKPEGIFKIKKTDDEATRASKEFKLQQKQADMDEQVAAIRGKTLGELSDPFEKAMWIRTYAQAHMKDPDTLPGQPGWRKDYPNGFQTTPKFEPDGKEGPRLRTAAGELQPLVWQSREMMRDAMTALDSKGNPSKLSEALGDGHKVRSFYNNMLDPQSPNKDSTIDTHEVGASWIRGLGQSDVAVAHNFGNDVGGEKKENGEKVQQVGGSAVTGINGTYGIYRDAHTQVADKLGIQPQQLQAVVWVAKKELFDGVRDAALAKIDATWRDYHDGKISQADAQKQAIQIAVDDKAARAAEKADAQASKEAKAAAKQAAKDAKAAARAAKGKK